MTSRPAKGKAKAKRSKFVKPSPYVVFISYSTEDSYIAHAVKRDIEELGAEAHIYEKDMPGGGFLMIKIREEIDACDEAITLITSNALKNPVWISVEIGIVIGLQKELNPVLYNVSQDDLAPLKGMSGIDLNHLQERYLKHLKKRMDRRMTNE
jgi:hypothetical protein